LKQAKDIRSMLTRQESEDETAYPESIKTNKNAKAFYDNLQKQFEEAKSMDLVADVRQSYGKQEDLFTRVVLQIDAIFKEVSKKPDWQNNTDVKNDIESRVDDILWGLEDDYKMTFKESDKLLELIRNIGINNY